MFAQNLIQSQDPDCIKLGQPFKENKIDQNMNKLHTCTDRIYTISCIVAVPIVKDISKEDGLTVTADSN